MIICEICNNEIGQGQAIAHKVIAWAVVKNGKQTTTVTKASTPLGYAHKICLETGGESRNDVGLFD
jgi:hypothetical protein